MTPRKTASRVPPFWLAVVFSAMACALAVSGSLMRPVWHDELYTLALARMPLSELFAALRVDSGPPLHYLICHALYSIVGWAEGSATGIFMVRLPSVMAFTLMPWVLWRWARGWSGVFLWAALLTSVWLPMLYFATEARAYAMLALVNAVLWLLGPELIKSGGSRLVLFSGLAAALPMLHYAGIVSFCFLPCLALFIPRLRWRSLACGLGAAALPLLMWSPIILGAPTDSMKWVNTSNGPGRPGFTSIEVLSPAGPFPALFEADSSPIPPVLSVAVLSIMLAALALGFLSRIRTPKGDREKSPTITRLAIGLLPVITLGCLTLVGLPVYFAGRSESMVWPLLASLAAVCTQVFPRKARLAALAPYAALGLLTIGVWIGGLSSRPQAIGVEIGRELANVLEPSDRVVVVGPWQLEVRHGLATIAAEESGVSCAVVETLPRAQSLHPGWFDLEAATDRPRMLNEAMELRHRVETLGERVWLVWSPAVPVEQTVLKAFAGWRSDVMISSPAIAVGLLTPPRPELARPLR